MKIQFSDRARQSLQPTLGQWDEEISPDTKESRLNVLLREVGAEIRFEGSKPLLRFLRPLERPEVEPERWAKAEELEGLFWSWVVTREAAQFYR